MGAPNGPRPRLQAQKSRRAVSSLLPLHAFREYDLRGLAQGPDADLSAEGFFALGHAFGAEISARTNKKNPTILVGRDGRQTSPALAAALITGLQAAGASALDAGLIPTPMLHAGVHFLAADAGVMITASHNPAPHNGAKFCLGNGESFFGADLAALQPKLSSAPPPPTSKAPSAQKVSFQQEYFQAIIRAARQPNLRGLRVVIDAGNGVAGGFAPQLLRQMGAEVVELFCEIDGNFPNHPADPERPENATQCYKKVIESGAHLGLLFDGDGDRLGFVTPAREYISADELFFLLGADALSRNSNATIVADITMSSAALAPLQKRGAKVVPCRVGHAHITRAMCAHGAIFGGESSGHLCFAEDYFGHDDALLAAAHLCRLAHDFFKAQPQQDFSTALSPMPVVFTAPAEKIPVPEDQKFQIAQKITQYCAKTYGAQCDQTDGARVNFADGAWFLVRPSNTSAVLSLRAEAPTKARFLEVLALARGVVEAQCKQ